VGVWIDAGSRYETAQNNGATHFLEKMAFKGTQKRTESQLKAEIASIGGHVNAYSTREQTVYYAKVFKDDVPKAMEILSDVLQNSKLDEETITQQRAVILKELEAANSDYGSVIFDHLHDTAFQGTGLSQSILGSEGNIRSLMKGDLQAYKNTHYTADKFVVAGAGAVDHKELAELTEKHFGGMKAGAPGAVGAAFDPAMFTGSDKRIRFDSMAVSHLCHLMTHNVCSTWSRLKRFRLF
jgi:processing peptidase subunit beta